MIRVAQAFLSVTKGKFRQVKHENYVGFAMKKYFKNFWFAGLVLVTMSVFYSTPASAGLYVCNDSDDIYAVGYVKRAGPKMITNKRDGKGWYILDGGCVAIDTVGWGVRAHIVIQRKDGRTWKLIGPNDMKIDRVDNRSTKVFFDRSTTFYCIEPSKFSFTSVDKNIISSRASCGGSRQFIPFTMYAYGPANRNTEIIIGNRSIRVSR